MTKRKEYEQFLKSYEWKEQRAETFDRSSGFCEFCGDVAINAHHVKYPKKFDENNPHNLVSVCKRCHDLSHGIRQLEKITDAKRMTDLAPNGVELRYLLTDGRVYASAKSWIKALKIPPHLQVWFETGLARTAMLKGKESNSKLEMEYIGVAVYRWHAVAEQLRAFDRRWYQDEFKTRPKFEQEQIAKFHENYEKIVSWGYDLQERALNSLVNPVMENKTPLTQDDLLQAIKQAVAPRLKDHDEKIHEHDVIISEIKNSAPVMRDKEDFITVKQAIAEQGLDSTSMPYYPNSRDNLSGLVGQILKDQGVAQGESVISRIDGYSHTIEVNTYPRGKIYEVLEVINRTKQARLF
jgi:hypothetical protein